MSLVRYQGGGSMLRPYGRFNVAGSLLNNPHARRIGKFAMNMAAKKVQNWWRSRNTMGDEAAYRTPVRPTRRRLFSGGTPTGAPQSVGVVPSGTSTRRVSRPGRRFGNMSSGRYRGKAGGRGRKRFKRRGRGKMMRHLWRMMHCPQQIKSTTSNYKLSDGYGVRTWFFDVCGSSTDLKNMHSRRPASLFFDPTTAGAASTQTQRGQAKALHVSKFTRTYTLQNRCNWMMHLKVYECLLRRDHDYSSSSGTTAFNNWCLDLLDNAEVSGINAGNFPGTLGGANNNLTKHYQNPAFTIYNSSPFCTMFKVIKCTSLTLSPNDYQKYTVRCRRKVFDSVRLSQYVAGGGSTRPEAYLEGHGKWSKVLVFTWVGGPVDSGRLTDGQQSKAANCLTMQVDTDIKFYYELNPYPLRTIVSSNAGVLEKSFADGGTYSTLNNIIYGVPYTEVVETVAAPSVIHTDDVPLLNVNG